jgi:glycosyltransferase involved in cell wall biosynthesis
VNILFYYPSNLSAVSLSSLMTAFAGQGHQVFLLTQSEEGPLHRDVQPAGVRTFSTVVEKNNPFIFYLKHARELVRFVKAHHIDLVYSHVQQANIVAVLAQRFCRARFIICRHHSDSAYVEPNPNVRRFDRIINRLGRTFIVPSRKVLLQMTDVEKVDPRKIHYIRYAYDFSKYPAPQPAKVEALRQQFGASLLLVKVARLIPEKRHLLLLQVMSKLVKEGLDIKLMLLSEGYLRPELEAFTSKNGLSGHVFFLGQQPNVIDYLSAADLVVHISASEASNNVVKEAALVKKPVIACRGVGDFDEYLADGVNSLLLPHQLTEQELENLLRAIYEKRLDTAALGDRLYADVRRLFSISTILPQYAPFHK